MTQGKRNPFLSMLGILAGFLVIAAALLAERMGVRIGARSAEDCYLPREQVLTAEEALAPMEPTCLVLTDLGREDCAAAWEQYERVLLELKIPSDMVDLGCEAVPEDLTPYETMLLLTPDMSAVGSRLVDIFDWVKAGGRLLLAMTMEEDTYTGYVLQKAGVVETGGLITAERVWFDEDFLIGGGAAYEIPDAFDSSLAVQLISSAKVYAWKDREGGLPLIWSNECGAGRVVVYNLGYYDIAFRGFLSAAYSLLEDVSVFPVLNGACIFLDDMPSPVPEGDSFYIDRDYGISVAEFYSNIWFRDIQNLSEDFGFPLIGLVIENYEDDTSGQTVRQQDTARFSYFGNLILRGGGELGYHGYNHQPLCLSDTDYRGLFSYRTWDSTAAMDSGFSELRRFCEQLYPEASFSLYVPPSNILSEQGRAYLSSLYPTVRTISGTYLPENGNEFCYVQEFGVAEDGIVEFPRVTAGSLLDSYVRLVALSELNYHVVFSHFIHPDDAMDVDRGADLGWETLYGNMTGFLTWLTDADPSIRRLDSAQMSGTIQRWSSLTVEKEWDGNRLTVRLGNFVDEAWLLLRINDGAPDRITGGTLTPITGSLYMLGADSAEIILEWDR